MNETLTIYQPFYEELFGKMSGKVSRFCASTTDYLTIHCKNRWISVNDSTDFCEIPAKFVRSFGNEIWKNLEKVPLGLWNETPFSWNFKYPGIPGFPGKSTSFAGKDFQVWRWQNSGNASGIDNCVDTRYRQILNNESFPAKFCSDTTENEPSNFFHLVISASLMNDPWIQLAPR